MGRIGIAVLTGVCCVHALAALPDARWSLVLLLAICVACVFRAALPIALLIGVAWAWGAASARLADELPFELEGQDVELRGYIASLTGGAQTDLQFTFDVSDGPTGVPVRIRLAWRKAPTVLRPGELWKLTARLKRRSGFANPGGFDYEGHLFHEGVGAVGYVRDDGDNERLASAGRRYWVAQIRAWLGARIAASLGPDPMLGVVQGLAIGDARAISAEQWRVFAATGTTHLMAISGLHIGMVAALMAQAGGMIVRVRRAQAWGWNALHGQAIAGVGAAVVYSTLAGLSIPTQRTLIMLCIYFGARVCRRVLSVGHALGLALIGVLIVDPFAPLAPGAWLSFGAVGVILLATSGRLAPTSVVRNFTRVQVALTLGLAPLMVCAFGNLSLIAPVANAIAVPLFTLAIVPSILIGALAAALSPQFGEMLLAIPAAVLRLSWPMLEWLAQLPLAVWHAPAPSMSALILLVIGIALLVLPGFFALRIAGAVLCLPAAFFRPAAPAAGDFDLTVLDAGQGLATVVRTHSHVLVYDAGPAYQSGRDAGERVVLPFLRHRGVQRIDLLMISHGDLDHRGGMQTILDAMPTGVVLQGPSAALGGGETCRRGQRWIWDDVRFEVLHPSTGEHVRDNDSSCVLRIQGRGAAALLTGDIEADAEARLLADGLAPAEIVVAPHHGSRTSSTAGFVAALHPSIVVFSAGHLNRWGFPKPDIVERWTADGARTFTTAESGAVALHVASLEPIRVEERRKTHRRYWRR